MALLSLFAVITPVVLALSPVAPAPVAGGSVEPPESPLGNERLSDELRLTRWAHAERRRYIHRSPGAGSPRVGRLRLLTEDGYPEVYLALRARRVGASAWIQVRIPARPNGQTGWVRQSALGPLHAVTTALTIDRRRSRATLRRADRPVWRSPIGHGAPGTPTPPGRFYIRERIRNLGGDPLYGPWAFGTSAYSALSEWPGGGVVGIHGTNEPWLIPGRPSHGCVRVPNPAIRRLAQLMPIGTPVRIH